MVCSLSSATRGGVAGINTHDKMRGGSFPTLGGLRGAEGRVHRGKEGRGKRRQVYPRVEDGEPWTVGWPTKRGRGH